MATIIKRDGGEVPVDLEHRPLPHQDLKARALHLIAEHAVITGWEETKIGNDKISLKLECVIERKNLSQSTTT